MGPGNSNNYVATKNWFGSLFLQDKCLPYTFGMALVFCLYIAAAIYADDAFLTFSAVVFVLPITALAIVSIRAGLSDRPPTPYFARMRNVSLTLNAAALAGTLSFYTFAIVPHIQDNARFDTWKEAMLPVADTLVQSSYEEVLGAAPCIRPGVVVFYHGQRIARPGFSDPEVALQEVGLELALTYNKLLMDSVLAYSAENVSMIVLLREDLDYQGPRSLGYETTVELVDVTIPAIVYRDENFKLSGAAGDTTYFSSARVAGLEPNRLSNWIEQLPVCGPAYSDDIDDLN